MSFNHNNAVPRVDGALPGLQSIHQVSAANSPEYPVGTRGSLPDGRVFYYTRSSTSAALNRGQLYVRQELVANHTECAVGATTSGIAGSFTISAITLGATAMTENQYKDGYLHVTDGAGEGQVFQIKRHAAIGSGAAGSVELYTPVGVSLDNTSTVSFLYNHYDQPQISATDQLDVPVGVPTFTITQSTAASTFYGWLQTWGHASILQDEAIGAIGQMLTIGTGVAGAVEEDDTATTVSQEQIIGYTLTNAVDTEYSPVFLTISR